MKSLEMRFVLIFKIVLMLSVSALMSACNGGNSELRSKEIAAAKATEYSKKAETISIVDQNGRTVIIPKKINRVVMLPLPLPAMYYAITGSADKIAGIHPNSKSNMRKSMLGVIAPNLLKAPTGFVKGNDINIEELLKIKPDLIFFWGLYPKQLTQLEAIHIPAVAVFTLKSRDPLDSVHLWINLLGKIFGEGKKTAELIAHNNKTANEIYARTHEIPKDKKPRALIIFNHSAREITVPGKGIYIQSWLEVTGAVNAAENAQGTTGVNMEQIYKWDPDIIYISNFCNTYPSDLINNTVERQDWSKVRAVRERRVYKIPSGIYRWCPPSADASLMLKWLAQNHHPALFDDYTMSDEIHRHFAKFYDYDISQTQIESILHPSRAGIKKSRI
jgi:iron complex transport system substrate-binding protein